MSVPITVAAFSELSEAEKAIKKLISSGVPAKVLSVVGKDMQCKKHVHGFVTSCDVAKETAGKGAWLGGVFGVLAGAAFVWIPGVGPLAIAGSLTSTLLGGIEGAIGGAAAGGMLGWLSSLGIEKKHILKYEEHLTAGRYLLVVNGSVDNLKLADSILSETNNDGLHLHNAAA